MMPEMDGETTIGMLQKINAQVKIIAISGLVSNPNAADEYSYSVKEFISKPFTGKELLHMIDKVTREFK